jgi:hypothetical protein
MADADRYALVIGSQCDALPQDRRLSFLPDYAVELYSVLTDPDLGACASALPDRPDGGLVIDPTRDELLQALEDAFATASQPGPDRTGSTLVVAMLGHGLAKDSDFYFLPKDARAHGRTRYDVLLSQHLRELMRDYGKLKGLIVWLDTCQAGFAAAQAARDWAVRILNQANRRFDLFAASDERPAYRGDFTRLLLDTIKDGLKKDVPHLSANDLKPFLKPKDQNPQLVAVDSTLGTTGLWLSYNKQADNKRKRIKADEEAGQRAFDQAATYTEFLQPTAMLDALVDKTRRDPLVVLFGYKGDGKSTLASALAQPEATEGHVDKGFVHAIAFGRQNTYRSTLASTLAGQLRKSLPAFGDAVEGFERNHPGDGETDALERKVFGPLRLLDTDQTVRLVIDAFDELPAETQQSLGEVIRSVTSGTDQPSRRPDIRFVVTARPNRGGLASGERWELQITGPDEAALDAYFHEKRGVDDAHVPKLVRNAQGNWLHAFLWANQAVSGLGLRNLSREEAATLAELYEAELEAAVDRASGSWETLLRPVLAVCAAAGTNPRLPRQVAAVAAERLGGPSRNSHMQFDDALKALSSLIVCPHPGDMLGIYHSSLVEEYFGKPELSANFNINLEEAYSNIVEALRELAPANQHNVANEVHRYALEFEPDHLWSCGRFSEIPESLAARRLGRAVDERERWQRWTNKLSEQLDPDDDAMVSTRENLAAWTGDAGDPRAARDLLKKYLAVRQRISGDKHEKTILTRGRIAYYTAKVGELTAASEQYSVLLNFCRDKFGPKHETTLKTWRDYARFTGEAGHPTQACDELEKLLAISKDELGDTDENTIAVAENLARFSGESGRPAQAQKQYEDVLPLRKDQSGLSPNTLITMSNLAYFTGEAGDPFEACKQYNAVLPLWAEAGVKHPDVLTTRANLARFTGEAGDLVRALDELNDVFEKRQDRSGPEHPDTLTTWEILARLTAQVGEPATAARMLQNILRDREYISGDNHPDTIATRTNLACFAGMAAEPPGTYYDPSEAAEELIEVSAMTERQTSRQHRGGASLPLADMPIGIEKGSSAPEHPDTLTIRAPLAHMNALARSSGIATRSASDSNQGGGDKLLETCANLQELVKVREEASGRNHPDTLTTMENLAYFVGVAGKLDAAVNELARLVPVRKEVSGDRHPSTLTTLGNLAYFALARGEGDAAQRDFTTLLKMRKEVSGNNHPDTIAVRRSLDSLVETAEQGEPHHGGNPLTAGGARRV